MRISKQVFILVINILVCAVVFYPEFVFAAASISLSGGTWALGTKGASSESTSAANAWTVTNDSGGTEDVLIKVTSDLAWTASTDPTLTANEFLLRKDTSSGQILTAADWTLVTSLANAGTNSFGLYFKTPPTGSEEGSHTLTVTLTATNWVFVFVCGTATVTDADGNTYNTVLIGSQCWMATNLNVGTMIAGTSNQANNGTREKYCYADTAANCTAEGGLYQWDEAMQYVTTAGAQGLCPSGWHIPTHDEFTTLERAVCTSGTCATDFPYDTTTTGWRGTNEGTKLKSGGTSGFNALLAGYRDTAGTFSYRGSITYFWSSLESGTTAWYRYLYSAFATVDRSSYGKAYGFSVRCLKD